MKVYECQSRFQLPPSVKKASSERGLNILNNGLAVDSFSRENAKKISFGDKEGYNRYSGLAVGWGLGVVLGVAAAVATGGLSLIPYYLAMGASTAVGGAVGAHKDNKMEKERLREEALGLRRPLSEIEAEEFGYSVSSSSEPEEAVVVKKRRRHKARKAVPARKAVLPRKAKAVKTQVIKAKSAKGSKSIKGLMTLDQLVRENARLVKRDVERSLARVAKEAKKAKRIR